MLLDVFFFNCVLSFLIFNLIDDLAEKYSKQFRPKIRKQHREISFLNLNFSI